MLKISERAQECHAIFGHLVRWVASSVSRFTQNY